MHQYQAKYKIKACGLNLHKLIAYFEQNSISLESLERKNHRTLIFTISKNDYVELKKHLIYKEYKFYKLKEKSFRSGLKFICCNLGLIFGIIFTFSCIAFTTNKIYEIDFNSENHVCSNHESCIFSDENQKNLISFLTNLGISKNVYIKDIPPLKDVESELVKNFNQISGAKVYLSGTRLHVDIVEAKINITNTSLNLIAPHNGIIVSTRVSNGSLKVKNGQTVLKGQPLVVSENSLPVSAEIIIRAFYHDSSIFNEQQISYVETGKKLHTNTISCFGLTLSNNNPCPYKLYNSYTSQKYTSLNMFLPIEVTTTTYIELVKKETFIDYLSVKELIQKDLEQKTKQHIPQGAEQKNTTFTTVREGSRVRTDCYVEVLLIVSK